MKDDVDRAIARLIYEDATRRHWRSAPKDPAEDPRFLELARGTLIEVIDWPAPELFPYANPIPNCLLCSKSAYRAVFHASPYHFRIAHQCCDSYDCLLAVVDLTLNFIRFDNEVNHRGQ